MSTKLAYLLAAISIAAVWYTAEEYQVVSQTPGVSVLKPQETFQETTISVSDGGQNEVTFSAEIVTESEAIVVSAALNTHSVDLNDIEFAEQIFLRKDGQDIYAREVLASGKDHHRSANMQFPQLTKPYQLVAKDVGAVPERVLHVN